MTMKPFVAVEVAVSDTLTYTAQSIANQLASLTEATRAIRVVLMRAKRVHDLMNQKG